jgi:hypothetical protein
VIRLRIHINYGGDKLIIDKNGGKVSQVLIRETDIVFVSNEVKEKDKT